MIINIREQHPVGQGFFHSGLVLGIEDRALPLGRTLFRYVYDCGAMEKYEAARNREIERYRKTLATKEEIDILFLSHAHADHINGVEALLKDHRARTIMMPLLDHEDRIAALARTLAEDPEAATDFYRRFVAEPAEALGSLRPDRIIFVRRGEGNAPGSGDGFPLEPIEDGGRPSGEERPRWKLVGVGGPQPMNTITGWDATGGQAVIVEQMSDSCALMLVTPTAVRWLLAPYVDPGIRADRTKFLKALAKEMKISAKTLCAKLPSSVYRQQLVTKNSAQLKTAYAALGCNLNLTSLCLYSGPAEDYASTRTSHEFQTGAMGWSLGQDGAIGWLATGDAALAEKVRHDALIDHYGDHLRRVATMTLPHHGSEGNFHADLLSGVDPQICLAAADQMHKWRHPGSRVVQQVASAGKLLFVATSADLSRFAERVTLKV